MANLQDYFNDSLRKEKFAILVAARVNDIRSGTASPLEFEKAGGIHHLPIEETLMFADLVARAVCAHLDQPIPGEESSE
ncbi:MAG: hypothetical protein WAO31_00395 [Rhodoluna sp.]